MCAPEGREELARLLRELTPGAPTVGRELTLEAGGRALIVAAAATRARDDVAGDRARVIFQDITARVRLQAEHAQLQDRYRQAQKLEAIGSLAGGVAHDFNNALTVITLSAQFALQQQSDASGLRRSIDQIAVAAKHATELTRQLLAFSRKQIMRPVVVDLDGLIERMHPMLARLIGKDVVLRTIPSGKFARINADPGQLAQVVVNLVINARDAMPNGGEILIETARVLLDDDYCARHADVTPGTYAMLAVSDTGLGMSPETREKIFEPFFSTKALGQGTGLGLATVFGIVKQSGGRIEVYSELDKGSSFKLYFPFVDAGASPVTTPPRGQPIGGRETVLLVEDEALVRQVAVESLVRLGYHVLLASSGAEAIAVADAHGGEIHLLLTDVVMPGMNGRELATRLALKRPGLKVLYASGFTENVIAHHGVLKPGVQFVAKPYTLESLAERVRAALEA